MTQADRPRYDEFRPMDEARGPLGAAFARQVLDTVRARGMTSPSSQLDVLDVGSGYGHTAVALGEHCRSVVGLEPAMTLVERAVELATESGATNVAFRHSGIESLTEVDAYDLVVLDNVYEHLPDQVDALRRISAALRVGGALYILVPNKSWPVEAHYRLVGLGWLPLRAANAYLRWSGRGQDYTDASYAPTYRGLRRTLGRFEELDWEFVLPADLSATIAGAPWHYRLGAGLLTRFPSMWAISKALLVVGIKSRPGR
jgi:SAM-dependent methyltransferase